MAAAACLEWAEPAWRAGAADADDDGTEEGHNDNWLPRGPRCGQDALVGEGRALALALYGYRGVGKALVAPAPGASAEVKAATHAAAFGVLQPEMRTILRVSEFSPRLCARVREAVAAASAAGPRGVARELALEQLGALLDVAALLDLVKDSKPCLANDISLFKRTLHLARGAVEGAALDRCAGEMMQLHGLFSNARCAKGGAVLFAVAEALGTCAAPRDVLCDLAGWQARRVQLHDHGSPEERWALLRTLVHAVVLVDLLLAAASAGQGKAPSAAALRPPAHASVFPAPGPGKGKGKGAPSAALYSGEVAEVLRRHPVVPAFGDLKMSTLLALQRCPSFPHSAASPATSAAAAAAAAALAAAGLPPDPSEPATARQLNTLVADARELGAAYDRALEALARAELASATPSAAWLEAVQGALAVMAECKALVISHYACKLAAPQQPAAEQGQGLEREQEQDYAVAYAMQHPAAAYALAVQLNYSEAELGALRHVVVILKGLASALLARGSSLYTVLQEAVTQAVQRFVRSELPALLDACDGDVARAKQHPQQLQLAGQVREAAEAVLQSLNLGGAMARASGAAACDDKPEGGSNRATLPKMARWGSSRPSASAPSTSSCSSAAASRSSSASQLSAASQLPARGGDAGGDVSAQQLLLTRAAVRALVEQIRLEEAACEDKTGGRKLAAFFSGRAQAGSQAGSQQQAPLAALGAGARGALELLNAAPQLLDLASAVAELKNVGELCLREFFLDITKCAQVPVTMSLPYLLVQSALQQDPRDLRAALEVYNDAAELATGTLRQRFLLEELEAELALVFEQLLLIVPVQAYAHAKRRAVSAALDPASRTKLRCSRERGALSLQRLDWLSLLDAPPLRLLGRTIDLAALAAERLAATVREDVEAALERFEAGPTGAAGLLELQQLLAVIRATHRALKAACPALAEFDEASRSAEPDERIAARAALVLAHQVVPRFRYDAALESHVAVSAETAPWHAPLPAAQHLLYGSPAAAALFGLAHSRERGLFGPRHADALVDLLRHGAQGCVAVVDQLALEAAVKAEQCIDALSSPAPGCRTSTGSAGSDDCGGGGASTTATTPLTATTTTRATSSKGGVRALRSTLKAAIEPALQAKAARALCEVGNATGVVRLLDAAQELAQRAGDGALLARFLATLADRLQGLLLGKDPLALLGSLRLLVLLSAPSGDGPAAGLAALVYCSRMPQLRARLAAADPAAAALLPLAALPDNALGELGELGELALRARQLDRATKATLEELHRRFPRAACGL
jgi:hypothetical protein